jgi:hypothetical protein
LAGEVRSRELDRRSGVLQYSRHVKHNEDSPEASDRHYGIGSINREEK